jgi:hypothetical protein
MLILGEQVQLKDNLHKSLRENRLLWALLLITIVFDFATTIFFMSEYGIQVEKNLVVRWLAYTFGMFPGVFIGKCLQLLPAIGFSALSFKLSKAILLLIVLLNFAAILVNLFTPAYFT